MQYQTMNQVADYLKQLIDSYWRLEISEQQLYNSIVAIFSETNNRALILRGLSFKAGFERVLGKKRLEEIKRNLILYNAELYKRLS